MTPKIAHYKCPVCDCNWEQKQGSVDPPPRGCPMCGSLYIKWLNYEDFDITLKRKE